MSDGAELLAGLVAIRGVMAAALVGVDGEYLAGEANDERLLERMVGTVTSALAAGEAMAGLLSSPTASEAAGAPGDDPAGNVPAELAPEHDAGQGHLMVMYQDGGPILFSPLPDGERIAVVALSSSHDIGRARFQLRSLAAAAD